jgi:hypothetical protein
LIRLNESCHREDPYLDCLPSLINRLTRQASDLEWDGGDAAPLWDYISRLKVKVANGNLYEPKF